MWLFNSKKRNEEKALKRQEQIRLNNIEIEKKKDHFRGKNINPYPEGYQFGDFSVTEVTVKLGTTCSCSGSTRYIYQCTNRYTGKTKYLDKGDISKIVEQEKELSEISLKEVLQDTSVVSQN